MRGRKPRPTHQRILDGNPGKRPLNLDEPELPEPTDAFDVPPDELAPAPRAVAEWRRLAPLLRQSRQVTDADRAALMALCLEWSRYLEAQVKVLTSSMIIVSPNGYAMPNPYLSIATKALAGCTRLWAELGLTPSSRSRVVRTPGGEDDAFSEFDDDAPPAPPPTRPQ